MSVTNEEASELSGESTLAMIIAASSRPLSPFSLCSVFSSDGSERAVAGSNNYGKY